MELPFHRTLSQLLLFLTVTIFTSSNILRNFIIPNPNPNPNPIDLDLDIGLDTGLEIETLNTKSDTKSEKQILNVNAYGFNFNNHNDFILMEYPNNMTEKEIFDSINKILLDLTSIESKGYLNSIDLRDFPVINLFINFLTKKAKYINGSKSMDSYKWIFNIIILNLYEVTIHLLKNKPEETSDSYNDLLYLSKKLFNTLDPSIRKMIQKRGISIVQNIQTGFDTEYVNKDAMFNTLLSVQLATNTQTYLKLPTNSPYTFSTLNTLTNETYSIEQGEGFSYAIVEKSIQESINRIRLARFQDLDQGIEKLAEGLKKLDFINHFEKEDSYFFRFPKTPTKQFIKFIDDKGYTLEEMVNVSNLLADGDLQSSYLNVVTLLKQIFSDSDIDTSLFLNDTDYEVLGPDHLPENSIVPKNDKALTRKYIQTFSNDRISVTRIRNNI